MVSSEIAILQERAATLDTLDVGMNDESENELVSNYDLDGNDVDFLLLSRLNACLEYIAPFFEEHSWIMMNARLAGRT